MMNNTPKQFFKQLTRLNKSEYTLQNYHQDLVSFLAFYRGEFLAEEVESLLTDSDCFLNDYLHWDTVSIEAVQGFVSYRMQQGISARTIARELSALRSFYQFLIEQGEAMANPAKSVKVPKQPKPLPKSLDVDLTQQLLNQPLKTWQDVRDQAIYECLYSAGLRVSELTELNITPGLDNLAEGWLKVLGKGKKERQAPLGSLALQALNNWLAIRQKHCKEGEVAVFVNRFGTRLGVRSIQKSLDKRSLQAGLQTKMSPHRLRHACATHVLESSQDLRAVQELLGHADLATTQIYTKLDLQHLANVYDKTHPRAKKNNQKSNKKE